MTLSATLGLNNAPFLAGLGGAGAALGGFKGLLGGMLGPLAAVSGGLLTIAGAAQALRRAVDEAAQMEDLEGSFATLLGSAEAGARRMRDLATAAAETPFDLVGLASTSRLLQAFTGDALATGAGLRLVGDSAAAVNQPLEAVGMWMGRLYASLREGQPLGEPIQNLTQLGLISGETRRALMAMQGQALDAAATMGVLETAFGRNAGAMARLAETYNGRMSTLKDTVSALYRELGTPIRDALKPMLEDSTKRLEGMVPTARRVGLEIGAALQVAGTAMAAGTWPQLLGDVVTVALSGAVNTFSGLLVGGMAAVLMSFTKPGFWAGLGEAVLGSLTAIGGKLLELFLKPAAALSAAILSVVERAKEEIGKIPVIGEKTGLSGYKAASFAELYEGAQAAGFGGITPADSAREAERMQAAGIERMIANFDEIREAFKEGFATGNLLDVEGIKARLGDALSEARSALEEAQKRSAEDAKAKPAAADSTSGAGLAGLGQLTADRLARIGGFIGGTGGPAVDYARRTAQATERLVTDLKQLPAQIARVLPAGGPAAWA